MVWEEAYQDQGMFEWYRRLIAVRHAHPCLTEGRCTAYRADDENGVIVMTCALGQEEATLLFHCKKGEASLPEYAGRRELLRETAFDGTLGPWEAAVL